MKPHRRKRSARSRTPGDSLALLTEQLAQLTGVADPRKLKPGELVRLINSSPLGQVLTDRVLRKQRDRAGHRIGDGKSIDLFRFAAWLGDAHHQARGKAAAAVDVTQGKAAHPTADYEAHKERARARQALISVTGRDIGPIPPVANPERRARALADPELFCTTYFPRRFKKKCSKNHRRSFAELKRVAQRGGKKTFAEPRADGKTTRSECMAIWAILSGLRRFVAVIGSTAGAGDELLQSIKGEFESNELLAADFPEVCFPIWALEGINNKCKGQRCCGEPTLIKWSAKDNMIVLPTIAGSPASGAVICCRGITGRIRGMKFRRHDGETVRPDLAIVDDPQTKRSAHSQLQCKRRLQVIEGDVLGLAGPGESIACFIPCTVIVKDDLADQLLDLEKHPAFQGVRTKLIESFPSNEALWEEYAELRRAGLRRDDLSAANAFYKKHRKAMNVGAVVSWEERYDAQAGELSAIQHAMNLRIDHPETFDAEYQNEPRDATEDDQRLPTAAEVERKLSGLPRLVIHLASLVVTAFIDVQQRLLYYGTAAWSPEFSGGLIDYGTWPDQHRKYFTYREASKTIQEHFPTAGVPGAIRGALDKLIAQLVAQEFKQEGGGTFRIQKILIDSGNWADVVYQCCRESPHAALLLPSKGMGIKCDRAPISEWKRHPGQLVGEEWMLGRVENKRAVRLLTFDTNFWKSRVYQGLATAASDRGCLSIYGEHKAPPDHSMLAAHLTSETRDKTFGRGRTVYVYKLRPEKPDNHQLDVLVGNAVCASLLGCRLIGPSAIGRPKPTRERPRVEPLKC
jgi:hypothetical protein